MTVFRYFPRINVNMMNRNPITKNVFVTIAANVIASPSREFVAIVYQNNEFWFNDPRFHAS